MLQEDFKVRYHELSQKYTVPVWILQNYFQEAAALDAKNFSYGIEELFSHGIAWVLINIQFKISSEIKEAQTVKVKTWHCQSDKIYSRRDFIIYNEKGEETAKGTSLWLILDLAKRKIARTPELMLKQKLEPLADLEPETLKPPSFEEQKSVSSVHITTRQEDIDVNGHVNNVHFSAWALEGVPEHIRQKMSLKEISVNYKAEAVSGENITVKTYPAPNNSFWHILIKDSDGKEAALAYTVWEYV